MNLQYQIPAFLQRLCRGVVWRGDTSRRVVYLTFDDGPVPEVTPRVLEVLRERNVKATFFMVGENAVRHPELVERVRQEGHSVGNHTYNHLKGTLFSTAHYMRNVAQADEVLHTQLFRPPYGKMSREQIRALRKAGYTICLWDVLTHDYNALYSAEKIETIVRQYTRNGSIINFHDSRKSAERMVEALPKIIDYLVEQGYAMETLS